MNSSHTADDVKEKSFLGKSKVSKPRSSQTRCVWGRPKREKGGQTTEQEKENRKEQKGVSWTKTTTEVGEEREQK